MRGLVQDSTIGGALQPMSKGYQMKGVRNLQKLLFCAGLDSVFRPMSKRFQMVGFRGSTQEKSLSEIFRCGYGKVVNDKMVPDPVGSGIFVLH